MTVSPDLDRRLRDVAVLLDLVDVGFDVRRLAYRPLPPSSCRTVSVF